MIAGDKAYSTSLKVYQALRAAEELDAPGIKSAILELGKRFNGQGKKNDVDGQDVSGEDNNALAANPIRQKALNENGVNPGLKDRNN